MLITFASTVADVAASLAALATVGLFIAACYAGWIANRQLNGLYIQLSEQRKTEGRRRVFEHVKQLYDRDFIKIDTEAQRLFSMRPKTPDGWEAIWNSKTDAEKFRIAAAMNFYEVFASDYNDPEGEVLDRATADRVLAYIADDIWILAQPFVCWLRENFHNERAYVEWEQLHRTFTHTTELAATASTTTTPAVPTTPRAKASERAVATKAVQPKADKSAVSQAAATQTKAQTPSTTDDDCPENPCVLMPKRIVVVAILWTIALVAAFFSYIEIDAVADFFPTKVGSLPFVAIWFGAVGGLLVSLEGIFYHNHSWRRSYDYWHYLRPVLGAIMGSLGCLIFIVLTAAAASSATPTPDATFYAVIALSLGYREKNFRELLTRLIDTIIAPAGTPAKTQR